MAGIDEGKLTQQDIMGFLSFIKNRLKMSGAPSPAKFSSPHQSPRLVSGSEVELSKPPSDSLKAAVWAIRQKKPVTLIHGRAGTGKTTLIRRIVRETNLKCVVVAPTGIAALNAGGQTIHSFFGIPPRMFNRDEIHFSNRLRSLLSRIDFIVIDEISMVRADLMDGIDHSLRLNRRRDIPFGGIPMVLVGDFLQLPPIVETQDANILRNAGYEVHFAFGANCLQSVSPHFIELETVYRQSDPEFIQLLGEIREGKNLDEVVATLNSICHRPHRSTAKPVILTSRKISATRYNSDGLRSLQGQPNTYRG